MIPPDWQPCVKVDCRIERPGDVLRASGVPPHVSILMKLDTITRNLNEMAIQQQQCMDRLPQQLQAIVSHELEQRAIGGGSITPGAMQSILRDMGVTEVVDTLRRLGSISLQPPPQGPASVPPAVSDSQPRMWMWGGKFRRLPETFRFPCMTILSAWQLWCCGDPSHQYPPFSHILPDDLSDSNTRKRLSDFRVLMIAMEQRVKASGPSAWIAQPSVEQANSMFSCAVQVLDSLAAAQAGDQCAMQMSFMTACKLLRIQKKTILRSRQRDSRRDGLNFRNSVFFAYY